jgi:1-acyl-sn-glycerol-3-phosphate acyltransferase
LVRYIRQRLSSIKDVLFVDLLALSFYVLLHAIYDIRIIGLDNYAASPSTVIAINHKRDLDFPMITPILYVRKTFLHPRLRPCLVARDDMFESGYFTSHSSSTLPFGRLLHHWNPASILHPLPAYPISYLARKPLRTLLYDVINIEGNMQLRNVIKAEQLQRFARMLDLPADSALSSLFIRDLLGYDYRALHELPTDVGILRGRLPRQVRAHSIKMVDEQLHVFAHVLDEGGTCLLAPEGNLWPDGRFWPVKSGLHRLISMTKADARILPVNITYDFMRQGRMPIYITLGEEILGARELPRVKLETLMRKRLVGLGPVTMGQLGSDYVLETLHSAKEYFQKQELAEHLVLRMARLKRAGLRLEDRLANALSFQACLGHFLKYCVDRGILTKSLPDTYVIRREKVLGRTGPNYWQNPIQFSYNELRSLREVYPGL